MSRSAFLPGEQTGRDEGVVRGPWHTVPHELATQLRVDTVGADYTVGVQFAARRQHAPHRVDIVPVPDDRTAAAERNAMVCVAGGEQRPEQRRAVHHRKLTAESAPVLIPQRQSSEYRIGVAVEQTRFATTPTR
ncbi:hypothetical protein [Nocardia iowensis]|uniref:Uncharacterized protein n=1 Tax=Nocardia iowensis TaxID=204891 RepID=A0ABX8RXC2_NOCIO|nr:hypothetical protein [Nocardia iowensis]QXN94308.1 hypothetical protein KV110_15355 [Nocardia iowensis]